MKGKDSCPGVPMGLVERAGRGERKLGNDKEMTRERRDKRQETRGGGRWQNIKENPGEELSGRPSMSLSASNFNCEEAGEGG